MGVNGGGRRSPVRACRLKTGDLLLLDGFTREVVHVQRFGIRVEDQTAGVGGSRNSNAAGLTMPEIQVRVSFINGSSITVPAGEVFEVVTVAMVRSGR